MRPPASSDPNELRLELPAAHSAERMARAVLREFAKKKRVPAQEIATLEFVASELLSNAVDHGGGGRAMEESELVGDVRVVLVLAVRPLGWSMRVSDTGGGDPHVVRARIASAEAPDLDDERGRGFFLMKQMLDGLHVESTPDGRGLEFLAIRTFEKTR